MLIKDWRKCWRMFSVQSMVLASAIQGAWEAMPADLQAQVSPGLVHWITITLLIFGIIGRLIEQPKVHE